MTSRPDPPAPPRRIAVLGSSGSIGRSTLAVVRRWPERFEVAALAVGSRWEALLEQIREFRPIRVCVADPAGARRLREAIAKESGRAGPRPDVLEGPSGARELVRMPGLDLVVNGLVGSLGLLPTLDALEHGRTVALANKEPLVVAGELVLEAAKRGGAALLPLDSELSAIHQCLRGNSERAVRRVILTASGGPFRDRPAREFEGITAEEALAHPTWHMGRKVTVDSATLMNKGLEIIETHHYFDLPFARIDVVVHPQSLVHSLVEFVDHSVMAQISEPDMCLPIQYALTWPERLPSPVAAMDLVRTGSLTFEEPDVERFPCLRLAREAGERGGSAPAVLNAANEVAVEAFLAGEIGFPDIPAIIEECLARCVTHAEPTLENFEEADGFTRREARRLVRHHPIRIRVPGGTP
jgi:1-deoxy-D-xylulose-5-phosphate reductoisomerase